MDRRGFLRGMAGILAAGAAPAVLPSGILMPIKSLILPGYDEYVITEVVTSNSNGLLTIDLITKEALGILEHDLTIAHETNASKHFESCFSLRVGERIRFRR